VQAADWLKVAERNRRLLKSGLLPLVGSFRKSIYKRKHGFQAERRAKQCQWSNTDKLSVYSGHSIKPSWSKPFSTEKTSYIVSLEKTQKYLVKN